MLEWLEKFKGIELSGDQKRILAYSHAHGDRFTSREYQAVIKTDIYGASSAIKDMIRKGVANSAGKGSRIYRVHEPLNAAPDMPADLARLFSIMQKKGRLKNKDVAQRLGVSRATASRLLSDWVLANWLRKEGKKRWTVYLPGERFMPHSQYASGKYEADA
jgi:predicted HTH transcriptional regulator